MKKRTALFKVLKNRFTDFVGTEAFFVTLWITFVIACAIVGFNIFKREPIPLTEGEIQYYAEQAELAYNKGLRYLDNNVTLKPIDNTTANIYASDTSYGKQKLKVTYLNNTIINPEPYYSDSLLLDRIGYAAAFALLGALAFIPIGFILEWIIKKIISIKEDIAYELERESSQTDEED